jgi:hypothetical protein
MLAIEKISNALKSASAYLENSARALSETDRTLFIDSLWHVTSELEYALFILSLMLQKDGETPKPVLKIQKNNSNAVLIEVKKLLDDVQRLVPDREFEEAYNSLYAAKNCILRVYDYAVKDRRETLKKK